MLDKQVKLTFMADETDEGNTFSGELCTTPVGILSFSKIKQEEIKGEWGRCEPSIMCPERNLTLQALSSRRSGNFTESAA